MDQVKRNGFDKNKYLIFSVTLMAVLGVASITPAFPTIIRHYGLKPSEIGYLITAMTIPGIILTPFMGMMADRLGRKTILVPSLLLFGLAGTLCTFAPSYKVLLILRVFQGIGASSLGTLNVTLIGDLYTGNKRTAIMGYNAAVLSIGVAAYPALGGLVTMFNWRYVFLFPILAIPVGLVVLYTLKPPKLEKPAPVKIYFANVWNTINQIDVWGLFVVNILIFFIIYGSYLTYFPLLTEQYYGTSPLITGIMMSLASLTTAVSASQTGKLDKRYSKKTLLMTGSLLVALSLLMLGGPISWPLLIASTLVFGSGYGLLIPTIQNHLVSLATVSERAAFMSVNNMVLRIGQSLGPIIISFFYLNESLSGVFFAGAGCGVLMIIITFFTIKRT